MEVEVTQLTRRGAAVIRRPHRVSADRIRFGRGPGNEVPLPDIRVELAAAALYLRDGRLYVERLGSAPMRVNRNIADLVEVHPGDQFRVGPYQVQITEPPAGLDAAVTIELVQPMGDSLARLTSGIKVGLAETAFSRRAAAWIGFTSVAVLFLVVPIALYAAGLMPVWHKTSEPLAKPIEAVAWSWTPGEFSNPHRFFGTQCATCHRASFKSVQDDACLGCHEKVGGHLEPAADVGSFRERISTERCTTCHEEHRGERGTVIRSASLCVDCHGSLAEQAPKAGIPSIGGFPTGHPQFRPTLVADATQGTTERATIGGNPTPVDHPGLKFSHATHLVEKGYPALGYKPLVCADCHVREPGGAAFLPITYKGQCQSCHDLKFDRTDLPWAKATVPHGDDAGVVAAVWNFYAGKALQGGIEEASAPAVVRRAAGSPLDPSNVAQRAEMLGWARDKAELTLRTIVLDDKRGCGYCHFGAGKDGKFDLAGALPPAMGQPVPPNVRLVAGVDLRTHFLPHARFDHDRHQAMACEDCHASRTSESSGDLLIPGIENCTKCHGGENASTRAGSTCVTCHVFHRNEFGPMRKTVSAAH